MSLACTYAGCAVGETGVCALEHEPKACEHRAATTQDAAGRLEMAVGPAVLSGTASIGAPVLIPPEGTSAFPASRTLAPDTLSNLMAARYITIVGILGDPESGKTACLVSLYLLAANAQLAGWSFADSKSLMAFEEIARGARYWNAGYPPDQMTVHTELSDDRRPGFLHLRLIRDADGRRVDLALPDLPGEWTTSLVETARADRFEFLKAAEAIWVVVDGRALASRERRQGVITRVGQLAGRLKTIFGGTAPRVLIVVTHRDGGTMAAGVSDKLTDEFRRRGLDGRVVPVAPFSNDVEVKPGFGIDALIDATVDRQRSAAEFWPTSQSGERSTSYLGFRKDR